MAFFYNLNNNDAVDSRIAERILELKQGLKEDGIPDKDLDKNLLLATWNIREFDNSKYGARGKECLHYIAEIISSFDLVAVQEVNENLRAFETVMKMLGDWWKFIITDITAGTRGNSERMAFVYDSRKIEFEGLAAEIVIPPVEDSRGRTLRPSEQLYRTPYLASFKCGWFRFMICTVHILYGKDEADNPDREAEIKTVSKFLADLANNINSFASNLILLGDFNIYKPEDVTFKSITDAGFYVPDELQELPSNVAQKKRHYDQIAFLAPSLDMHKNFLDAGVFNFYDYVYTDEDEELYIPDMGDSYYKNSRGEPRSERWKGIYYRTYWRTYQMSDHLPMWIQLKTDFGQNYLESIAG